LKRNSAPEIFRADAAVAWAVTHRRKASARLRKLDTADRVIVDALLAKGWSAEQI